jgi:hypothetical protein
VPVILVMASTLLCASVVPAAAGVIAQEEEASLGEDSLADGIVSDVLNDHNVVDQGNTAEQDAAVLSIQEQAGT